MWPTSSKFNFLWMPLLFEVSSRIRLIYLTEILFEMTIYEGEIVMNIPSYVKTERERMKVVLDTTNQNIFMLIPGRHLDGVPWTSEFYMLEKGEEGVNKLLEENRRIRWSEIFEEKVLEALKSGENSEIILIDTVNWQSSKLPKILNSSNALIESRKAFGVGRFTVDALERQFLRLIPRLRKFLRLSYEKIYSMNYYSQSIEKVAESAKIYEKLIFFIMVQFEEPTEEFGIAINRLRKFFKVENCPFKITL